LTDAEIDVLNQNRAVFQNHGITLCISGFETIVRCRDKSRIGSNIPAFRQEELHNPGIYPIIAKPKHGRSSEGKFRLESPTQLPLIPTPEAYIFQPCIDGDVITVDFVRDGSGNTVSVPRRELIRTSNGAGIVVEVFEDEALGEIVRHTADALNILGCVNVEFLHDRTTYYLMDVNPRFSAGIGFSCAAGYDFVKAHLDVFRNRAIDGVREITAGRMAKKTTIVRIGNVGTKDTKLIERDFY